MIMTTTGTQQATTAGGRAWRGSTALVLVVLFLAGTFASAAGMHGCPQHHHTPSPDAVASWAGPGDGGARSGPADGGRGEEDPTGPTCTCLGDCQSGAPTALHEPPVHAVPGAEPVARTASGGETELLVGVRSEYFLPYPLGPPGA